MKRRKVTACAMAALMATLPLDHCLYNEQHVTYFESFQLVPVYDEMPWMYIGNPCHYEKSA